MLMATSLFTVSLCAILSCMLQIVQHWFQSVYAVQLDRSFLVANLYDSVVPY